MTPEKEHNHDRYQARRLYSKYFRRFQFISYYHPKDYIQALYKAYQKEENPAAKDAMAQILVNSRMCAEGHRPICQDTGIATVFLKVGMDVQWGCRDERTGNG